MARAWVTAVPPGIHQAPQGPVVATPERIQGWHAKYQRMKAMGIDVPVPWGHHPDALPGSRAKFNAGYLRDSRVGPKGSLDFLVDVPGAEVDADGHLLTEEVGPDGVRRKAAIREVSAGIRDWTDGQRRRWEDAVVHLALVTHPVVAGQKGFTAAANLATKPPGGLFYLSTHTLGDTAMADEAAVAEATEETPADIASEEAGKGAEAEKMLGVLSNLARLGIPLPEDTDAGNFVERLDVALGIAVHQKEVVEADAAAEKSQADAGAGGPVTEEARPVTMSTLSTDLSPRERLMLEKRQAEHRNALAGRINKLVKLGLPVEKANKLKGQLTTYTLALDESLAVVPRVVDEVVEHLEGALKALPPDRKTRATLTVQPNPAAAAAGAEKVDPAEIAERAARVSRPADDRWTKTNGRK
jgi:hypothetical protein